jgi:succinate-semialdehyde dehydrogenase/glutarate-semialdehyde dehydrogenase
MMKSIQPWDGEVWATWTSHTMQEVESKITFADQNQADRIHFPTKAIKLASLLRQHQQDLAHLITREMGKPITQSLQEIEKCAICCEYYAENASFYLKDEEVLTPGQKSIIRYERVGVWLAIMPWNFPFWQVFRCAIPALAAGNNLILKHASNVQACAHRMETLFYEAGFEAFEFQNIVVTGSDMDAIVAHPSIKGVSLTGSEATGARVAAIAGGQIKPVVLELGGSNAFIVTETADIKRAVEDVIIGRFQNNGQSCIAAKRLLVDEKIYDAFMVDLLARIASLSCGNPLDEQTFIGPLAKVEFNDDLLAQVYSSLQEGADVACGSAILNGVFQPTILTNITLDMTCMREELFGPVLPVYRYSDIEEAIRVSNNTAFGLGVSIYGQDTDYLFSLASRFEEGAVFINSIVKSDPRLPFGGAKRSGIGRELAKAGLHEFVNVKTIVVTKGL